MVECSERFGMALGCDKKIDGPLHCNVYIRFACDSQFVLSPQPNIPTQEYVINGNFRNGDMLIKGGFVADHYFFRILRSQPLTVLQVSFQLLDTCNIAGAHLSSFGLENIGKGYVTVWCYYQCGVGKGVLY